MVRGHYVLDTVRYDTTPVETRGRQQEGGSLAFASSRFNPANRAQCESSSETTASPPWPAQHAGESRSKHQSNTEEEKMVASLVIELLGDVDDDEAWNNNLFCSHGRRIMPRGSKVILTSRSEKMERFEMTQAVRLKCLSTESMHVVLLQAERVRER
jgi:hypothetical protein